MIKNDEIKNDFSENITLFNLKQYYIIILFSTEISLSNIIRFVCEYWMKGMIVVQQKWNSLSWFNYNFSQNRIFSGREI